MIVLAKSTTYGFRIRLHSSDAERTAFSVTPTNWLVRFAVAPLMVAFDPVTRHVLRYEGRVPPLRVHNGRAREFDARVDDPGLGREFAVLASSSALRRLATAASLVSPPALSTGRPSRHSRRPLRWSVSRPPARRSRCRCGTC